MRPKVKLGEIGIFIRGVSYKKGDLLPKRENGCISLLRSNNIQTELDLSELQYLNKNSVKNEQIAQKGDILFCMSNGSPHLVGKNVLLPELENYSFGAFCSIFRKTNESALSEYIAKYLQSGNYTSFITSLSRGAGINNLRGSDLENIEIPLPPLETQKAIVARLDQIFAELDQTKSEIQKNLDNTDEFLNSAGSKAFQEIGNIKILGEVCTMTQGIQIPLSDTITKFEPGYKRYIYISDLIDDDHIKYVRDIYPDKEVSENDLIMVNTGSTSGKIYWGKKGILSNNVFKIVGNENIIIQKYLYHYLKSYYFQSNLERQLKHGAQPHLGHKIMSKQIIPVPLLSEQEKIVEHLDQVSKEVKALKSQYQSQFDNLEELKKSVLDKAFRGELGE